MRPQGRLERAHRLAAYARCSADLRRAAAERGDRGDEECRADLASVRVVRACLASGGWLGAHPDRRRLERQSRVDGRGATCVLLHGCMARTTCTRSLTRWSQSRCFVRWNEAAESGGAASWMRRARHVGSPIVRDYAVGSVRHVPRARLGVIAS